MEKYAGGIGDMMRSATRALYVRAAAVVAVVSVDENSRKAELILNVILVTGIVCLGILDALLSDRTVITLTLITFIGLFISSKCGHSRSASYILVGTCIIGATYSAWIFNAGLPTMLLIFIFISIISGLIINSKTGFLVSALLVVILTILGIHEVHVLGLRVWEYEILQPTDIVAYMIIILFIAGTSWLSNRELRKLLRRARQSEKELEYERDLLEIKVAERTAELSRIAEFGRLARGLFHDLMTPLTSVALQMEKLGRLEEAVEIRTENGGTNNTQTVQETQDYIKKAVTASHKMASFMENIRQYMRQDGMHGKKTTNYGVNDVSTDVEEKCDISSEATFVIELLSYKAREAGVVIKSDFETRPGIGRSCDYPANPFYFYQIFQNLISNAIEACANLKDKIIRIKIANIMKNGNDEKDGKISGGVKIVVSDNGPGITAKNIKKIFEPFFTTKAVSGNVGIGLHTVKTIVKEKLKGKLTVESVEGVGTTFILDLP